MEHDGLTRWLASGCAGGAAAAALHAGAAGRAGWAALAGLLAVLALGLAWWSARPRAVVCGVCRRVMRAGRAPAAVGICARCWAQRTAPPRGGAPPPGPKGWGRR